ncbi:hypothetical protein D1007_22538 [Hordeum vulgare]|nr:hypothetical protein D1007_22538 [Hordeum vulgare]
MALVPSSGDQAAASKATIPWSEMLRSASVRRLKKSEDPPKTAPMPPGKKAAPSTVEAEGLSLEPDARLALYIGMAHARLATTLHVFYGLYLLHPPPPPPRRDAACARRLLGAVAPRWVQHHRLVLPLDAMRSCAATLADVCERCWAARCCRHRCKS